MIWTAEADQDDLLDFLHLAAEEPPEVGDLVGAEPQNSAAVSGISSASSMALIVELLVPLPQPIPPQEEQQSPPPQDGASNQAIDSNQPPLLSKVTNFVLTSSDSEDHTMEDRPGAAQLPREA
ncbi:hypothetical protein GUJ93_ZPchr0010g8595 [Zizania palustris]|uniref:Uncharacterized protein n=1 Tax=Zizania palustris TaxID=103762 RepID=A0A8J5W9Q7_ZIZPA|nr:hypothetical protein GUJ93_ZPchr0010g8595 [Zizania palustris]